jgi:hypothetical protein
MTRLGRATNGHVQDTNEVQSEQCIGIRNVRCRCRGTREIGRVPSHWMETWGDFS